MARTLPTTFKPLTPLQFASIEAIVEGASGAYLGPTDLAHNIHYLFGEGYAPTVICDCYSSGSYTGGINGLADASKAIKAIYAFEPPVEPFDSYTVVALYANTSASDGVIRLDLGSDPWISAGSPGTSLDLVAVGSAAEWTQATGTLEFDGAQTIDTVRVWPINAATGLVRLKALVIYPKTLASIDAGSLTVDGLRWVPTDDAELDADSPWSIQALTNLHANLEHIRRTRKDFVCNFSSEADRPTGPGPLDSLTAAYSEVARMPFRAAKGQSVLRWALHGHRAASATAGAVRLRVVVDGEDYDSEEITLQSTWSTPYTAAQHDYADVGQSTLSCIANRQQYLHVDIKGDGSHEGRVSSLAVWLNGASE